MEDLIDLIGEENYGFAYALPNYENISDASEEAKLAIHGKLKELGLSDESNMSIVHPRAGEDLHAIILGIPSLDELRGELVDKAIFTYGSHIIDDWFDRHYFSDDETENERLIKDIRNKRKDLDGIYDSLGNKGDFCRWIESQSTHPEGTRKAIHRIIYNGLIQQAYRLNDEKSFEDFQKECLNEYMELSLSDVNEDIAKKIRANIDPMTFYPTGKTVQEGLISCEKNYDPTFAELWNVFSAWFIYYQNIEDEKVKENIIFYDGHGPKVEHMIRGVELFKNYVGKFADDKKDNRALQIEFCLKVFDKVLPEELKLSYSDALYSYRNLSQKYQSR
jgi:hypothetical protein